LLACKLQIVNNLLNQQLARVSGGKNVFREFFLMVMSRDRSIAIAKDVLFLESSGEDQQRNRQRNSARVSDLKTEALNLFRVLGRRLGGSASRLAP
jgi:hypothetical protein